MIGNSSRIHTKEDHDDTTTSSKPSIVDSILDTERKTVFENKQLIDSNMIIDYNRIYSRDERPRGQWLSNTGRG